MNKIRGTPKNTHYNPDHKEKHTMPLHTLTTILQISAGIMILYGIHDEYKRYRDKKKGKSSNASPALKAPQLFSAASASSASSSPYS